MKRRRAALAAVLVCATLAGCSTHPRPDHAAAPRSDVVDGITIPPPYVAPIGTVVAGPTSCPSTFASTLSAAAERRRYTAKMELASHLITCNYQAVRPVAGDCSGVKVVVNTEPQAFKDFDRWNVETGQNSSWTNNPTLQPVPVAGIGIEAEWVPALLELGTGNDTTWVSVILTCPASTRQVLALAERLALEGLDSTA